MNLNLRIRDVRKAKKLTLAELAEQIGISSPHLSEVERGHKNLNNHLIKRLCEALDCQPKDLFSDEGAEESAGWIALKGAIKDMSDDQLKLVIEHAELISKLK